MALKDSFLVQPQQFLIECKISPVGGNTKAQNKFEEQDFLIGRPIIGLQAFSASDMPFSPISNLPVIPDALFPYAFLNINRAGLGPIVAGQWYKNIPLITLRHVWNNAINLAANPDMFRCDPMTMQWPDSNIAFPTSQALGGTYSVPLLVTYLMKGQNPKPYRMAFYRGESLTGLED